MAVEHPKVKKCLEKTCDEVKGSLAAIQDCYKSNYAELGEDALETNEEHPEITSKSVVQRLLGQKSTVREIQSQFVIGVKRLSRTQPAEQARALSDFQASMSKRFERLFSSLESIHADAAKRVGTEPVSEAVVQLVQVQKQLGDALAATITDLAGSIPKKRTA